MLPLTLAVERKIGGLGRIRTDARQLKRLLCNRNTSGPLEKLYLGRAIARFLSRTNIPLSLLPDSHKAQQALKSYLQLHPCGVPHLELTAWALPVRLRGPQLPRHDVEM
jgi:hypothetical protein